MPRGIALEPGELPPRDFGYPAVLKPRDAAGSDGVRLIESTPVRDLHVAARAMRLAQQQGRYLCQRQERCRPE